MQSRMKLLGSTALAAAAIVMAVPTASAQDIGALEKRVKALEKSGGGQNVTRSKKTMKLVVSGHINRVVSLIDNGNKSGIVHATSIMSRSRVRWVGTGKINDDLSVRTYIEFGNLSASSTAQSLQSESLKADKNGVNGSTTTKLDSNSVDQNNTAFDERHIDLQITSKTLGKLYIGQGVSGSESTSERDLSGTGLLSLNGDELLIGRATQFQFSNTVAGGFKAQNAGNIDRFGNNFDGLGRRDRVRYDTPKFAGFQITTSHGNADVWDVALRYGGSIGGVKLTGAVAYSDTTGVNGIELINGSFSVLLPMGLSFTVAGADQSSDFGGAADNTDWVYGKIGYKFNALELGQSRLYVSWGEVDDRDKRDIGARTNNNRGQGNELTTISVGLIQIIEPLGLEFQLGYTNFELDLGNSVSTKDIDIFTIGLRAKF